MRAVWRAGKWLSEKANRMGASELLARRRYVNVSAEIIDRGLNGQLVITPSGEERQIERFVEFFEGVATFLWRSQAVWMARRLAIRHGLDVNQAIAAARSCFRPDLYREHLGAVGAVLPAASEKIEGLLHIQTLVAASAGRMVLGPDQFFDGHVFDPDAPDDPAKTSLAS